MYELLSTYINPMIKKGIDHLVLGCSHYPYLIPLLNIMLPEHVKIIDSGEAVARQTKAVLSTNNWLNPSPKIGSHTFYTNGNSNTLELILKKNAKQYTLNYLAF